VRRRSGVLEVLLYHNTTKASGTRLRLHLALIEWKEIGLVHGFQNQNLIGIQYHNSANQRENGLGAVWSGLHVGGWSTGMGTGSLRDTVWCRNGVASLEKEGGEKWSWAGLVRQIGPRRVLAQKRMRIYKQFAILFGFYPNGFDLNSNVF
jgi:hypothetical protein